jgi:hypothetical protein
LAVRKERWAEKLLTVLRKATQNNPRQRHQTVKEFWQELSQINSLIEPEKQELVTHVSRRASNGVPQPHVARGYTPFAPQQPKFNTSRNLKLNPNIMPLGANPNLVVRLNNEKLYKSPSPQPSATSEAEEEKSPVVIEEYRKAKPKGKFLRRFAIALVFIGIFAGALFFTDYYLRGRSILSSISNPFAKQDAVALMNINLRSEPNRNAAQIGIVTKDSRIQILDSDGNWYKVAIIEQGSQPDFGNPATQGWISGKAANGGDTIKILR